MSDKDKTSQQLSAYLDGELSEADQKKLQAAIEGDEALAEQLRQLKALRQLLRQLPRAQAGDDFVSGVMAKAERRNLVGATAGEGSAGGLPWVRWLALAAVLLIAVGIGAVVTVVLNQPTWSDKMAEAEKHKPVGRLARDVVGLADNKIADLPDQAAGREMVDRLEKPAAVGEDRDEAKLSERPRPAKAKPDRDEQFSAQVEPKSAMRMKGMPPPAKAPAREAKAPAAPSVKSELEHVARSVARPAKPAPLAKAAQAKAVRRPAPAKRGEEAGAMAEDKAPMVGVPLLAKAPPPERPTRVTKQAVAPAPAERLVVAQAVQPRQTAPASRPEPGSEVASRRREAGKQAVATQPKRMTDAVAPTLPAPAVEDLLPAERFAEAQKEIIFTDDLPATRRRVERVLLANDVMALVVRTPSAGTIASARGRRRGRGSTYYTQQETTGRRQVQYLAYVTVGQMSNVTRELENIRGLQVVSQLSHLPSSAPAEQPQKRPLAAASRGVSTSRSWIAVEEVNGQLQLRDTAAPGQGETRSTALAPTQTTTAGAYEYGAHVQSLLITLNYRPAVRREPGTAQLAQPTTQAAPTSQRSPAQQQR